MTSTRTLNPDQVPPSLVACAANRDGFREEYPFDSHWMEIDGRIIHYVDEGQGPVLLMVHGNPTWSFAWRRLVRDMASEYRVIVIDHLGCGFSEKPQADEYTLDAHIGRLVAFVEQLDLKDVTLFAHDWGGAIGMGCAGRVPDRFRRFVLMNTAAFRSRSIPLRIAACRIPTFGTLGMRALNLFSLAALRMASEQPLSPAAKMGFIAPYNSWANRVAVKEFVHDIPLQQSHRSYATLKAVEDGLKQFQDSPMLLIWGMKDWCFSPEFYQEFCERFPDAERHPIADAGHYIFEDAHDELLATARDFLHRTK
ncbi:MAG: alpha/beta fold hydrolase [Fuerstiella sp.]